jgi:ABC-type Mn2+/Zn2+ transport system permease subunit
MSNILKATRLDFSLVKPYVKVIGFTMLLPIAFAAINRSILTGVSFAMCFIAMTIVLSIRLVGIMLLMSLLTLPQITVNLFTSDFKKIIWGSIAIGFLGCVSGLVLSYFLNVPSGAFIILFLVVLFLALKAIKPLLRR